MDKLKDKINEVLPLLNTNLYYKNKLILSEKSLDKLENNIKKKIKNPSKKLNVFIIEGNFDPNDDKNTLSFTIAMYDLTPDLELEPVLGYMKSFYYSKDDLKKYEFNKIKLNKLVNAVKNRTVSFRKISSSVKEVFEISK
jgi:hypothetical protein